MARVRDAGEANRGTKSIKTVGGEYKEILRSLEATGYIYFYFESSNLPQILSSAISSDVKAPSGSQNS